MKAIQKVKNIVRLSISLSIVDFKIKNEGAYLGILWYLLEPMALFGILILMRDVLNNGSIENYAAFLFLGLAMFNFFRVSTSAGIKSISSSAQFIKSMQVPSEAILLSKIIRAVYSHLFEVVIIAAILFFTGTNMSLIIFYPIAFFFLFLFSAGISFFLAPLGALSDDFSNLWMIFLRILWFLTPIFYETNNYGPLKLINSINPLAHIIDFARTMVIQGTLSAPLFVICLLFSFSSFFIGIIFFEKLKKKFAEWV